jgi:hypothetical protein
MPGHWTSIIDFDLVFSNAALHWVDDHSAFLRGVAKHLCIGAPLVLSCGGAGNASGILQHWRWWPRLVEKDMIHDGREALAGWIRTTWLPYTQRLRDYCSRSPSRPFDVLVREDKLANSVPPKHGRLVVTSSAEGTARLWDGQTGRPVGLSVFALSRFLKHVEF